MIGELVRVFNVLFWCSTADVFFPMQCFALVSLVFCWIVYSVTLALRSEGSFAEVLLFTLPGRFMLELVRHLSYEIDFFVEPHFCKLRGILRSCVLAFYVLQLWNSSGATVYQRDVSCESSSSAHDNQSVFLVIDPAGKISVGID